MDIMSNLFNLYLQDGISGKKLAIVDEMEMLDDEYSKASEVAMEYFDILNLANSLIVPRKQE